MSGRTGPMIQHQRTVVETLTARIDKFFGEYKQKGLIRKLLPGDFDQLMGQLRPGEMLVCYTFKTAETSEVWQILNGYVPPMGSTFKGFYALAVPAEEQLKKL